MCSRSYDSAANAVSLETGYRYDIALSNGNTVSLTPQAQVVWQITQRMARRITTAPGSMVRMATVGLTRLGLRVDGKLA
ncbi:autotransporter outer membrane beta-barrel domain-containing protein [Salmonella enterica subsp. enterica]|nr:autotransporter outer membrane beta-barrel domain-containing protein [Salmonella enterica subsp. enterica]